MERNEENLNEAQRLSKIGSFRYDLASNQVWWSDQARQMLAIDSLTETTPMQHPQNLHPEDRHLWDQLEVCIQPQCEQMTVEYRLLDGAHMVYHAMTADLVTDENGRTTEVKGTIRDITEQRSEALIKSTMLEISEQSVSTSLLSEYFDFVYQRLARIIEVDDFYITVFHRELAEWEHVFYNHSLQSMKTRRRPAGRWLSDYVMRKRSSVELNRNDIKRLIEENELDPTHIFFEGWAGYPLINNDEFFGIISMMNFIRFNPLTEQQNEFIHFVANQTAQVIDQHSSTLSLQVRSMRDSLTGLYNRFYLDDELARLQKSRLFPISLIVLDVDNLGVVNETRGHTVGDTLLVDVARLMHACFRQEDVVGRSGGDDFTAVLPQMNEKACAVVVDRFEGLVRQYNESADPPLEVLIGFNTASQGDSLEICLRDAEAMVHQRKKAKREPGL